MEPITGIGKRLVGTHARARWRTHTRTREHNPQGVLHGYSSTRVSLWDSLVFGRLAMGFANVRAGTRVLMLVLVQALARVALPIPEESWGEPAGRGHGAAGTAAGMASSAAAPDPGTLVRPRGGVGKLRPRF